MFTTIFLIIVKESSISTENVEDISNYFMREERLREMSHKSLMNKKHTQIIVLVNG